MKLKCNGMKMLLEWPYEKEDLYGGLIMVIKNSFLGKRKDKII